MKFDDYEKRIRDSFPMLIESYVEQYGEEYRSYIEDTLNNLNIYIYVMPEAIYDYVEIKEWEDKVKGIIDGFNELGIDTSKVKICEDCTLEIDDEDIALQIMVSTFFPNISDDEKSKKTGLNLFNSKYNQDRKVIKKRLRFLEKLGEKENNVPDYEYINSSEYLKLVDKYQKVLNIFNRNIKNHYHDMSFLIKKAEELDKYSDYVADLLEKEFMVDMYQYLPDVDKKKIVKDKKIVVSSLESYNLYFGDDGYGLLEYFQHDFSNMLKGKHVSKNKKDKIIKKRLEYLKLQGFDTKKLKNVNLYCDWKKIDMIKDYLPDFNLVEKIFIKKEEMDDKYNQMLIPHLIINNKEMNKNKIKLLASNIDYASGCFFYDYTDNYSKNVCFNVLADNYNLYDIIIDHELRHAIEASYEIKNGKTYLKTGNELDIFDDDTYLSCEYDNFNELITQKLSIEATTKRWHENKFILSDEYALQTDYPSSDYDEDIPKVSIIFDEFRDEIMKTRINQNMDALYRIIPKSKLVKINRLVTFKNRKAVKELILIRDELKATRERGKTKIKSISTDS